MKPIYEVRKSFKPNIVTIFLSFIVVAIGLGIMVYCIIERNLGFVFSLSIILIIAGISFGMILLFENKKYLVEFFSDTIILTEGIFKTRTTNCDFTKKEFTIELIQTKYFKKLDIGSVVVIFASGERVEFINISQPGELVEFLEHSKDN